MDLSSALAYLSPPAQPADAVLREAVGAMAAGAMDSAARAAHRG